MYSQEFMKFLINYQQPEPRRIDTVKRFDLSGGTKKLAAILLTVKK